MKTQIEIIQEILGKKNRSDTSTNTHYSYSEKLDALISYMESNHPELPIEWARDIRDHYDLGSELTIKQKESINKTIKQFTINLSENL